MPCYTEGEKGEIACVNFGKTTEKSAFPQLEYKLRYARFSDGGPSDWYFFSQKIARVCLGVAVFVCMVLTFTTH